MDAKTDEECYRLGHMVDRWYVEVNELRNNMRNIKNSVHERKNEITNLQVQNRELDALEAALGGVGRFTEMPGMIGSAISSAAIKYRQTKNSIAISRLESEIAEFENQNQLNEIHVNNRVEDIAKATAWRRAHKCPL